MILNIIIALGLTMVGGFIGLFPSYTLPDTVTGVGNQVGEALASANGIFPVVVLGSCIVAMLGLVLFLAAWDAVVFIYDRIPFKAT